MNSVYWNDFRVEGKALGSFGYATYQMKIILPETERKLGIKFMATNSAFCAYADANLLYCSGKPGMDKKSTIPYYTIGIVPIPEIIQRKKNFTLTIHIANYHHSRGGFNEKFLGDLQVLQKEYNRNLLQTVFLAGSLFFMAIYHFGLFYFLRNNSALYFAIYCIISIVFLSYQNNLFLYNLFSPRAFKFILSLEYFTQNIGASVFLLFINSIYDKYFSRRLYLITLYSTLFLGAFVLFTPSEIFTRTLIIGNILILLIILQSLTAIALALRDKRKDAKITILGFIILFGFVLNDVLYSMHIISSFYLLYYGTFIFLFFQSYLLIYQFIESFKKVKVLSNELAIFNKQLEALVEKRTIEFKKQKEKAENANRLKDKFVSIVSHDLISPILGVINLLKISRNSEIEVSSPEKVSNLAVSIESLENVKNFAEQILSMDRLQSFSLQLKYDYISIKDMFTNCLKQYYPLIESKNIKVDLNIDEDFFFIGDEELYIQAISNIISNSIKFSHSNSRIFIGCTYHKSFYKIKIRDEGIGIEEENIPILFRKDIRFQKTGTRGEGGHGFGLSFCYDIIKAHKGSIRVKSQKDKGSTFIIEQPFSEEVIFIFQKDVKKEVDFTYREEMIFYCFRDSYLLKNTLNTISPNFILIHFATFNKEKDFVNSLYKERNKKIYIYSESHVSMDEEMEIPILFGDLLSVIKQIITD